MNLLSFVEFEQSADMFVLASWYREQGYYENPVVVIVEDIERCCGSVLSDFIIMLRYFKEPYFYPISISLLTMFVLYLCTTLYALWDDFMSPIFHL